VAHSSSGFHYKLSEDGLDFAASLNTDYANTYYETARRVLTEFGNSERTLGGLINQKSIASMRED
jgi:hypothetical protein